MNDAASAEFGALLRLARRQARLSQQELGGRARLSIRTVRNLENGQTQPRVDTIRLLTGALGLTGPDRARFEQAAGLPASEPAGTGAVWQLPRDLPDFGEREETVAAVEAALLGGADTAVGLVAVTGAAGVGKTALAVHVAHRLRDRFPDGQLHVRLRSGDAEPLPPGEVLGRFLRALGLDGSAVPPGVEERAALFRSRLTGRRLLVLLDDAGAEEQVRPLLPGAAGNAVLLTSRRALVGLEGVRTVAVDVLDPGRAVRLLGRIAGPDRVAAEAAAADRIAAACGGLPLALRVAGARLAAEPAAALADLATVLTDERGRLDELAAGDLAVRASFAVGYRDLDEPARRAFRLLGLLGTPDFPAWAVAAVLDTDPGTAGRVTDRLARTGLLETHHGHRFALHDLVRLYARERAEAEDPVEDRRAAVRRALSGWAVLADEADRRLPSDALALRDRVSPGWRPDPAEAEAQLVRPLDWFERERPALVAAVRLAAEQASELCAGLADSLVDFCATRDYPDDWAAAAGTLLRSATGTGDRRLAGHAERRLAELGLYRNDEQAVDHAERAVELAEAVGDRPGAAAARLALGAAYRVLGRPADGRDELRRALAGFTAIDDPRGTGHVLNELSMAEVALGDLPAAREHAERAVRRLRADGDLRGEARALISLGTAASRIGDQAAAVTQFQRSLQLGRELDDRSMVVVSAVLTGRLLVEVGDAAAAVPMLTEALAEARGQHRRSSAGVAALGLGEAYLALGELAAAREWFGTARGVLHELGMVAFQGMAEVGLGDVALAEGDPGTARVAWEGALTLLDASAPPRAETLRARLAELAAS